jgi:hypothetical protein
MSILVEIAQKANVSVEGVVRVLTREPVSDAIKQQVLAALDDLTPAQTRVLQRFALAALHEELPRGPAGASVVEPTPAPDEPRALLGPGGQPGDVPADEPGEELGDELAVSRPDATALEPLRAVLTELAEAVRDLRAETNVERRERVDDLAAVIDLISSGWQGIERRLGRIEQHLGQIEAARRQPPEPRIFTPPPSAPAPAAARTPSPPLPPEPEPAPAPEAEAVPEEDDESRSKSRLVSLATTVGVIGAIALTFVLIDVLAGRSDTPRLLPVTATDGAASTVAPDASSTTSTSPAAKTTSGDTSVVLGTAETEPTAPQSSDFTPARQWAWAPVADADYYAVEFHRNGKAFFRTRTAETRLTLPASVDFSPGAYRWIVRPGYGTRAANELGPPLVDSSFTVS